MSRPAYNRIFGLALAALVFVADQFTKWLMIGPLQLQARGHIDLLPFFDLTWTENRGISLGLFSADTTQARWMLLALTGLISLVIVIWMMRERLLGDIAALALVLGGALGNIRDRMTYGYVVDFADFQVWGYRPFLIFNLADAAITIGVVILLVRALFMREKREPGHGTGPADRNPDHSAETF
ncbi:signal peptidase II [Croceibacterium sp. TMG7-5b_MA50]|uniref:signal peptidase II n=1 Tax=Croceibacterium sp. TMG7-5b_MA50 TaxID=3121290 RepID=UPI003221414A